MTGEGVAVRSDPLRSRWVRGWIGLLVLEAAAVVAYFAITGDGIGEFRYVVYPFLWINAGLWAVLQTSPDPGTLGHRMLGLAIAITYFLAVMIVSGKVGLGAAGTPVDLRIGWYVPGWGPLVAVQSSWVRLFLVPFEVIGYGALSYLVYANALQFARGTLSGALGLVTCVGCTVPVLAPLVGVLGGPASSLTTTAYAWSYDVGTLVFLVAIGLLYRSHEGRLPW